MDKSAYLFDIAHTDSAKTLHELRQECLVDAELFSTEKDEICKAIARRFAQLNAATKPNRKPRLASSSGVAPIVGV